MSSTTDTAPVTVIDWRRYYGEILYQQLAREIPEVEQDLKDADMWHPLFTPAKVTGMIMASHDYGLPDLYRLVTDHVFRADVTLDALDVLTAAVPAGTPDPTLKGRHPDQKAAIVTVLEGEAAKAIHGMRPLFTA